MLEGVRVSAVYTPESLNELLLLLRRHPTAVVYAGGTYLGTHMEVGTTVEIVSLQRVTELHRVTRSDRAVDIGAAATIETVLRIGGNVLPEAFTEALVFTAPTGVRSLATVGGNLCVSGRTTTAAVAAHALEARVEVRKWASSRWIPIGRFRGADGTLALASGEVVTRIRIPLESFTVSSFRRLEARSGAGISFCGLARLNRGVVESLRMVFAGEDTSLIRHRDWEADIVGRRLPIGRRDLKALVARLGEYLAAHQGGAEPFDRERMLRLARWFLQEIDEEAE